VDWPEHMEVVYHFKSTQLNHSVVIKAKINTREKPEIETVSDIWRTAEFHEREVYDLFGIVFKNHPDLRRIFLDDDWEGYPMRKDYVDEVNIVDL
jgi:NADH:ubiquinone oxidoreductase subunit C